MCFSVNPPAKWHHGSPNLLEANAEIMFARFGFKIVSCSVGNQAELDNLPAVSGNSGLQAFQKLACYIKVALAGGSSKKAVQTDHLQTHKGSKLK
jgi:hypothetical protein